MTDRDEDRSDATSSGAPSFEELFERHDGPRAWKWLHYLDVYERHLAPWRGRAVNVLEIGVLFGGTTRILQEYLGPRARLFGIDNQSGSLEHVPDPAMVTIGDQGDRDFMSRLADGLPRLDIVIDDGSHLPADQITSFEVLYPRLAENGLYIVEDTHTSYWPNYNGGYGQRTFVDFGKDLIDRLHAWYWYQNAFSAFEDGAVHRQPESWPVDTFAKTTWAIHFYDSMCVVEKRPRAHPSWRFYGGENEAGES